MSVSTILSFDPASFRNLGWAFVQISNSDKSDNNEFNCIAGTMVMQQVTEPWQVLWPLFSAVDTIISAKTPDLVIIEKTSSFSGGFITGQVSNCIGVILACCGKHNLPVQFVYPTHVKKVVTGAGRATKSLMKKSVKSYINDLTGKDIKFDSEHACDALANILCWLIESKIIEKVDGDV